MTVDLDLAVVHDLAVEVDATHRLVEIAAQLVDEILDRAGRIERRIDGINGDDPGVGDPTRMDRILDLSRVDPMRAALLNIADRICDELDQTPPSIGSAWTQAVIAHLEESGGVGSPASEAARQTSAND